MQSERHKALGPAVLLVGPPGAGKVEYARRVRENIGVMVFDPFWSDVEYIRAVARYPGVDGRPAPALRAPHHSCSMAALRGVLRKGWRWQPGELSLAHGGVLLLDEVNEFRREAVEAIARAWRVGRVELVSEGAEVSSNGARWFPTEFRVIAACNPCPCGFRGVKDRSECHCPESFLKRHDARIDEILALFPGMERVELP